MTNNDGLRRAAIAACETLLAEEENTIPANIAALCAGLYNTAVKPYSRIEKDFANPPFAYYSMTKKLLAAVMKSEGAGQPQNIILYSDIPWVGTAREVRFAIAHELGHLALNHQEESVQADKEADCFALCLLCPVPVLDALAPSAPRAVSAVFHLPYDQAGKAFYGADRLRGLIPRELYSQLHLHYDLSGQGLARIRAGWAARASGEKMTGVPVAKE